MKKISLLITLVVLLISCTPENLSDITPAKFLKVKLTDAASNKAEKSDLKSMPPDSIVFQQLNIDLLQVRAKTNSDSGWINLPTNTGIYNLVELQGTDTMIANGMLEGDTLKELRFVLGGNNTIMVDSVLEEISIPGSAQSGLKLKFQPGVYLNGFDSLLIDFNSALSVHQTGNGTYKLKPVLHLQ